MREKQNIKNNNSTAEQNISESGSPIGGMSTEELYRQKEGYDAKFTLYKGSLLQTDKYVDSSGNHK